jgi:hypothetical protein
MSGKVSGEQLEIANQKAQLCEVAAANLEQAGRGMVASFHACKASTATLSTIEDLAKVSVCLNEAIRALLAREQIGAIKPTLQIPG